MAATLLAAPASTPDAFPQRRCWNLPNCFIARGHEFKVHGIGVGELKLDLAAMQKRKAGIVKGMTGGIAALFKAEWRHRSPGPWPAAGRRQG